MISAKVQIVFATCYPQANLDTSNHTVVKTVVGENVEDVLELAFHLQGNNLEASKFWGDEFYSLSVGDTVWVSIEGQDDSLWIVCPLGFAKMTMTQAWKWEQAERDDRYWMARDLGKAMPGLSPA